MSRSGLNGGVLRHRFSNLGAINVEDACVGNVDRNMRSKSAVFRITRQSRLNSIALLLPIQ